MYFFLLQEITGVLANGDRILTAAADSHPATAGEDDLTTLGDEAATAGGVVADDPPQLEKGELPPPKQLLEKYKLCGRCGDFYQALRHHRPHCRPMPS